MIDDEWGDLEYLYNACQVAITDEGLMKYIGINEWGDDEYDIVIFNDNEMRNVSQVKRPENWQKYVQAD